MTSANLKAARSVKTAPVTALGLIGGWLSARESGIRPLGSVLLGTGLIWAARTWTARDGVSTAVGLSALYMAAFGASHPLAKRIGSWPAVLLATAVASGAAYAVSDRKTVGREQSSIRE